MDYHDNDFEDQNLHLAGEESSKVSSVLRPFALPKFDFDDNLHGHLRFDSLVENEVFLGIPSQEDNHWIEDFSRGSGGIVFSSSATESCALPRHDNVWSEATSSESVEMLLKAVGQEEMVPGENVIGESNPVDQLGSSTTQMELKLKQDSLIDKVGNENSSLLASEVDNENSSSLASEAERDISRLNKTTKVGDVHTEFVLRAHDTKITSCEVCTIQECSLIVTNENLDTSMKSTSENPGELSGLLNESVSKQVPAVPGIGIDNTEGSSQVNAMCLGEAGVQRVASDIGFVSAGYVAENVFEAVKEDEEGDNTSGERIHGSDPETVVMEMHRPVEFPAKLESVEDHAVDVHVTTIGEAPSVPGKGESASSFEGFNEVASDPPFGVSEYGTMVFSSSEIKQLSEGCNVLPEKSSTPLKEELVERIGVKGSHADGLGNLSDSSFTGEQCMEKTVIENVTDATIVQKDHALTPLLAEDSHTDREDIPPVHVDIPECKQEVTSCDKEVCVLPLDSTFISPDDNERKMGSTFSGQGASVNNETAIGPPVNASNRDFPVFHSEDKETMLTSSHIQEDNLADCHELGTASYELESGDQNKHIEFGNEELRTSISKESFEVADEFVPGIETEKGILPDSAAARESRTADQSAFSLVTSSGPTLDEASKELSETAEHPAHDLIAHDDVVEAAPSEKTKEAEVQGIGVANFSSVPATGSGVELDESNQLSSAVVSFTELSQNKVSKLVNLEDKEAKSIGNFLSTSLKSGVRSISKEEGTFTFDVRPLESLSIGVSGASLPSIPSIQACKSSMTGERSPSTSGRSKVDPMTVKEISHVSSIMPDGKSPSSGLKGSTERKSRRGSSKSGKESVKKGNQAKGTTPLRQTERGDKSLGSLTPRVAGQVMKFESFLQPRGAVSIPTSNLPDLNTSTTSAVFQQPFTDLQQVQLRAQIFVYGSLIQGVAPDEACMVSAFDEGKSIWEPTWRACVERLQGQKSLGINTETPMQSHTDQINRQYFPKSEVLSSPAIRPSNKVISSPVVNPMIPLSSPLWNISTPSCEALPSSSMSRSSVFDYQVVSHLLPFQSPPIRNLVAQTTSWPSQAPFPVPWLPSSQTSSFDASSNYAAFPIPESIKLTTPVKESSVPISSGTKHVSSIPAVHTAGTAILPGTSSLFNLKKMTASAGQSPANSKARKRKKSSGAEDVLLTYVTASPAANISATVVSNQLSKKSSASDDFNQISLLAGTLADSMPTSVVSSHYTTPITVTTPSFVPKGPSNQFFSAVLTAVSGEHRKSGDSSMDKRTLNLEDFSMVEDAKLKAEEASVHAAAAVKQCQVFWSQLEQQKKSGLTSDFEAKLASTAVAIAAAASVAKAAAAAAKIASSAAIQAKQMADEATTSYKTFNTIECDTTEFLSSASYMANATPISILKGGYRNHPSSFVISAAREAARKRVEAASTATRHAENLDAILRAAELAADAVSHAGKIVTMGVPLHLSELVVAGPDGYWKILQSSSIPDSKLIEVNPENSNVGAGSAKDILVTSHVMSIVNDHVPVEENPVTSVKYGESNSKACNEKNVPDSAKTIGIVSESRIESRSNSFNPAKYASAAIIKVGSLVEVFKDHGDFKKAWYLANVLSLKDGEALVRYSELQSDQVSEPLKEWVPLEVKDGNPAIVRIPHPMSTVQFEGGKKRRRAAVKDHDWSVGDRVDAWVQNCWREGVIVEDSKKDPTALSVHFPGIYCDKSQWERLDVKVWHLRPTVIWIDGQWIEWFRTGQDRTSQRDTPNKKRAKLGSTVAELKGEGKESDLVDFTGTGKNEPPNLSLSANEKAFNIGSTKDGNKSSTVRIMRSGLQKEGSRGVVFGVPKPGKKRKFMEVSKHYVSDKSTETNVPSDSVKLSKFLMPQGSGPRGWKKNSNIDSREKQVAEVKLKGLKPGKPPAFPSRTLTRKDDSTSSRLNASDATSSEVKGSISSDDIEPSVQNLTEFGSSSIASEGAITLSSQALPPENRKKTSTVNAKSERFNKRKLVPASGKTAKSEANISEAAEPRRSNRRIQPTSRLLEGLQSSLTMTKLPSFLHEKSHSRGTSRGINNQQ